LEQQHSEVLAPEQQLAELHKLRDQTGL